MAKYILKYFIRRMLIILFVILNVTCVIKGFYANRLFLQGTFTGECKIVKMYISHTGDYGAEEFNAIVERNNDTATLLLQSSTYYLIREGWVYTFPDLTYEDFPKSDTHFSSQMERSVWGFLGMIFSAIDIFCIFLFGMYLVYKFIKWLFDEK